MWQTPGMETIKSLTAEIANIALSALGRELESEEQARLDDKVQTLRGDIFELFEAIKGDLTDRRQLPSDDYLDEQLVSLSSYARMALGVEERTASAEQIADNIVHYQHKINGLIGS